MAGATTETAIPRTRTEFVVLVALMVSLVALSIDSMLPALPLIAADLGAEGGNDRQLVVSALFLGLALAQMVYGPLSDSIGRKPSIYLGFGIFITGCCFSILARDFPMMLVGRFLQGVGAAGPRVVSTAMVRDLYQGRAMARVISLTMTVFILVPVFAPLLGQLILGFASWREIFLLLLGLAGVAFVWFWLRQPETLSSERRHSLSFTGIIGSIGETCRNRTSAGYTLAAGLVFGAFIGYLNSSQQIFQDLYGMGLLFPVFFGVLALAIGLASALNARLVMQLGMRVLCHRALRILTVCSIIFTLIAAIEGGVPPLWALMIYLTASFFCVGILFGNFNALAMESLGHIAGVAASVIGSITTLISLALGTLIGRLFDGTVLPMIMGFTLMGCLSIVVTSWADRGQAAQAAS